MVKGIKVFENNNRAVVCIIEEFSDELKELIRENLSAICHGAEKAERNSRLYSYQRTLKEFLQRYETKSENTKKGMIGELLSHVIFLKHNEKLTSINPFFNMEEKSIKKGFDIIFVETDCDNKLWITEVKSGNLGRFTCSDDKNNELLTIAKNDLKTRLNSEETQIWYNAINGASLAIRSNNLKNEVVRILEEELEESLDEYFSSKNKNVILTSVLFNDISDCVKLTSVEQQKDSFINEDIFNEIIVFSIQKNTYQMIVSFLKGEVEG